MPKPELFGVQGLPRERPHGLLQGRLSWPAAGPRSIGGVAQYGVTERGHVDTYLMRAPCLQRQLQQTEGPPRFQHAVMRTRCPSAAGDDGHFLSLRWVPTDRRIDRALRGWHLAVNERLVAALQRAGLELCRKVMMAAVVLGD